MISLKSKREIALMRTASRIVRAVLDELEQQIEQKKHLPNIPSAEEMKENGVGVADLQMKLLQKIEELTLYAIEQNKKINKLQKENSSLKIQNKKLHDIETRLSKLEEEDN